MNFLYIKPQYVILSIRHEKNVNVSIQGEKIFQSCSQERKRSLWILLLCLKKILQYKVTGAKLLKCSVSAINKIINNDLKF